VDEADVPAAPGVATARQRGGEGEPHPRRIRRRPEWRQPRHRSGGLRSPRGETGDVGDPEATGPGYNDPNVGAVDPSPLDDSGYGQGAGPDDDPAGALGSSQQGPLTVPGVDAADDEDDDGSSDAATSYGPPETFMATMAPLDNLGGDAGETQFEDPFATETRGTPPEDEPLFKGPDDDGQ